MQSESRLREEPELAQKKKTAELLAALKQPPQKRSGQQANRIAQFLSTINGVNKLTPALLNRLVHQCYGAEYYDGQVIYRASDSASFFYIIVEGNVVLTDVKDKGDEEDENVIARLGNKDWFGHEEILSSSRRAFTASALKGESFCIRVPIGEYRRGLEDIHMIEFDDKVGFLSSLAPMRPLKPETVRKLAPCFSVSEFKAKEVVVRQGEKADAMYAIRVGSCHVVVDPHYKSSDAKLGTLEAGKTLRIVTLNAGAIIGDITVLASVTKRTASVIASTDLVAYKICRSVFLRRVPPDQLDILRRIANEKLNLTASKIQNKPTTQALQDKILHGRNLRELSKYPLHSDSDQNESEEYQELIHLLRRYKRSPVPKTPPCSPASLAVDSWFSPTHAASQSGGVPVPKTSLTSASSTSLQQAGRSLGGTSPTKYTSVAARLGAELEQESARMASNSGSSSPEPRHRQTTDAAAVTSSLSGEERERVRASSPRWPGLHIRLSIGQDVSPAKFRSAGNSPKQPSDLKSSKSVGVLSVLSKGGSLRMESSAGSPCTLSGGGLQLPGNVFGLAGGEEELEDLDQPRGGLELEGSVNTGSEAVSATLAHHLGLDTITGLTTNAPPYAPASVSFSAPRKDIHTAQSAKRQNLPSLAHVQGPSLSAYSDIQPPVPVHPLKDEEEAQHVANDQSEGAMGGHALSLPAGASSRPGSGVLQGRRSNYHTRPLATSNTLRTIPPSMLDAIDARYGPLTNSHTHHSSPSHSYGALHQASYGQQGPGRPISATVPNLHIQLSNAEPGAPHAHMQGHSLLDTRRPCSAAAGTVQLAHTPHAGLHPHSLTTRPSLYTTHPPLHPSTHTTIHPVPNSPAALQPSPDLASLEGSASQAIHAPQHSTGMQHTAAYGAHSHGGPSFGAQAFNANTQAQGHTGLPFVSHQGEESYPSGFQNQDPLGPINYTQRPPSLSHGPLKSIARLKASVSGPCMPASRIVHSLDGRKSLTQSDGEVEDEGRPGLVLEAPSSARSMCETSTGWSSGNLALPQHRTLAAAGGLQRYLRQLQYNKELDMLQAMERNAGRFDAALDKMAGPLLDTKVNPMLRKGASHYRPTVPKALL